MKTREQSRKCKDIGSQNPIKRRQKGYIDARNKSERELGGRIYYGKYIC